MTLEHGIVHRGVVLSGSERVIRDPLATWTKGRETRDRAAVTDVITGHWTAGHHRIGPGAGLRLFRAMEARKSKDGSRDLSVSIHFGVAWDGGIWQYLDLSIAAVHVGLRHVIARSIGIEPMWAGTSRQARKLGIAHTPESRTWRAQRIDVCPPSDAMREAVVWLCEYLASDVVREATNGAIDIPHRVAPKRSLTMPEMRRFRGLCEHASLPGTDKIDAAGEHIDALAARGWTASV